MAEEFVGWTPYHYVHQNPINLIDPTGMSAEGADGGGWLSKVWNSSKNEIKSWFGGRKSNYEVIVEEPQLIGWDYGESVPYIECHHNTTATNGEKIKGSGSIAFSGQGYESFGGWEDIRDKLIVSKSTDWSSYKFGKTPKFKDAFDGFSKGVSIGEDKNIQSLFKSKKANEEKPMDSLYPQETRWFGISVVVFPKIDSIPVNISPNSERGRAINTQNDYYRKYHNEYMKDSVIYEKSR